MRTDSWQPLYKVEIMLLDSQKIYVIYDGKCRFCCASVGFFNRLDWLQRFTFFDGSDWPKAQERFSRLASFESANALCVVDGEKVYWGFFAVRRMMWSAPLLWPIALIFYFPGASCFGPKGYAWVANNRYRIGCKN